MKSLYSPTLHTIMSDERSGVNSEEEDEGMTPLIARQRPHDSYCLVYGIFFMLGIGSLLPWNFFITAKHYWLYKLNNGSSLASNHELHTDLSDYFESYLAIASTVPSVLCLVLNYLLVNRLSSNVRILLSLAVILLVFIITTVLVKMDVSGCRKTFLAGTLASVALVSGASNIFSGSMFGISAYFPMRISQALISGQAMGGTLSAVASIVDLAAASDETSSALAYFLTADIFIIFCIILYLLLPKVAYSRYYLGASCTGTATTSDSSLSTSSNNPSGISVPPLRPIMGKMWKLCIYVFWIFFISITIFPAISSGIQSVDKDSGSPWSGTYFVPLTSFLLYNVADFSGRQMTIWLQVPGPTSPVLPILVACRTALVPLFMFCNYQPRYHLQRVFFAYDLFPVIFVCLLGLSNGYLGTLTMIYGPKVVPRDLAEPAGVIMSFFLAAGLAAGSAFSVLLVYFF
ncbi:equilibrative nucleoside transporter 3 [Tachysurus fulvidraco]|uniref:equilibrative nucleoside transporter 3 n=1 Tax=Tachysurus fulvidraco TaxID=1234273 RepID=UPI000F5143AC|nr:equilibrative nucleoside transporter 3 [Tachysurus fulvidraco]XP_027006097.1 equilibrative nucleoside transporter 3 [Tachysurus fulvidraco]XP_027006098.1 equilibrative nucleoside transporter 3 [Tachysurus fulvidraco]XP_027006100.1 equilibrative nucleoside transporter 3 [Tachysurus fulvidraco]XP_027006101.1 equilibrative nucleoside transporter 3 [Tachysurus fulvidraco]XP_047668427.1 equilibrative nucleoside transporter 3 [Tachysurus fulvidraco]XP_047668428.1 equilibrative nucleoside transpo